MVATKFYLKYHITGMDRLGNPIDKKFKSMEHILYDCGEELGIYNRQGIYKIINGFHNNELTFEIIKIRELIRQTNGVASSV
jgi:hypothetical protein